MGSAADADAPSVAQMVAGVALMASNLCRLDASGQTVEADDLMTEALSACFVKLPLSLSNAEVASCMAHAEAMLNAPHLTPRVTLKTALSLLANPVQAAALPPTPADTFATRLSALRWLTVAGKPDALPPLPQLHHALALCLLSIRRAVAGAACNVDALLPLASHRAPHAGTEGEAYVLISNGTFDIVEHDKRDGRTVLLHQPGVDGQRLAPKAYGAYALLAGEPAALSQLELPCRARLSLISEDDTLVFRVEELMAPLPAAPEALGLAMAQARQLEDMGQISYAAEPPPCLKLTEELQRLCIAARRQAQEDGGLPELADAQIEAMLSELELWRLILKAAAELRGWRSHVAAKPLASDSRFAYQGLRQQEAESRAVEWRLELERRCHRVANRVRQALQIPVDMCAALPTPEEVAAAWQQLPPQVAPTFEGAAELRAYEGLAGLRAALVPGLVRTLHAALLETGKEARPDFLHESFGIADLLADERYKLYECFDQAGLNEMLRRLRASAMEMLGRAA